MCRIGQWSVRKQRVPDQDAPQDARVRLVSAPNELAGLAIAGRSSQEAWHAVPLVRHAFEKLFALIAEATPSPSAVISGVNRKRCREW